MVINSSNVYWRVNYEPFLVRDIGLNITSKNQHGQSFHGD